MKSARSSTKEFFFFHPYFSFSSDTPAFLDREGKNSHFHTENEFDLIEISALWRLGKEAYSALGIISSHAMFDSEYQIYQESVQIMRELVLLLNKKGVLPIRKTNPGFSAKKFLAGQQRSEFVEWIWSSYKLNQENLQKHLGPHASFIRDFFLFACLEQIENVIMSLVVNEVPPINHKRGPVISSTLAASRMLNHYREMILEDELPRRARSAQGAAAAAEKKKRDPKQGAKALVHACWLEWKAAPERYSKQSEFALDMLEKVPQVNGTPIISFDTILKKWIPEWSKSNPTS